jgi:hypothetical protein
MHKRKTAIALISSKLREFPSYANFVIFKGKTGFVIHEKTPCHLTYTDWINVIVQNFVPRFVPTFISIGIYHCTIFDLLDYFKNHIGIICHWIGDFSPLSTAWMLKAKSIGKPLLPILVHSSVHGLLMGIALVFFIPIEHVFLLVVIQIASHFCIDVWKGKMNIWFPFMANPTNKYYWLLLGFDQMLHQSVIVLMVHYAIQ